MTFDEIDENFVKESSTIFEKDALTKVSCHFLKTKIFLFQ